MKVSLSWLQEYVPVGMSVPELADALTMTGLEVDSLTDRYAWLDTVRVGRVVAVNRHPNADKLTLCDVDIGDRQVRVVCGAPNVREGLVAPLALPGTEMPDGRILERGVIRGEKSEGMLCSQKELALGDGSAGLMELPEDLTAGATLSAALNLSDSVIEIGLTPNRPDCLSIMGVAREVAALQGKKATRPEVRLTGGEKNIHDLTSVTIEAPDHCPRYTARMIEGVTVAPSPLWLKDRLLSVGLRPINNIVDITNFVMLETGQPLHAFDFDHLAENRIVVRTASEGEKFTTLDKKERTLSADMLMICDGEKPVGVAGVMGGLNSEIEAGTTRVLIESAYFDPSGIRKTAKRLGLNTDASHRFERGVDPEGTLNALDRATELMVQLGGGTLVGGLIDGHPVTVKNTPVKMSAAAANRHLGTGLTLDQMAELLASVEFEVEKTGADTLVAMPPSFRVDVSRPQDLMEEIARLWGYNRIPVTFPAMPSRGVQISDMVALRNRLRDMMAGFGFAEAINYSFISEQSCDRIRLKADAPGRRMLHILNPLSEEQTVMRTSLLPGLLESMGRNLSWQNRNLRLFETGKIFLGNGPDAQPDEIEMTAGLWTGTRRESAWHTEEKPCDFYDLKGIVEGLLTGLGIADLRFTALPDDLCDSIRPGYSAAILAGSQKIGRMGEVHPKVLSAYDLKQTAFVFELDMTALAPLASDSRQAAPVPKYPPTARDITLIVDKVVEAAALTCAVREMNEPLVEDIFLFAVFEGEKIPAGKKSVSFRIVYRSHENTLEDDTVNALHQKISEMLLKSFNAAFPS